MRVAVDVLGSVREPYFEVHHEHVVGMQLRPGFIEMGLRSSEMTMVMLEAGEIGLCPSHMQQWVGTAADLERLSLGISDDALMAICDGMSGEVELLHEAKSFCLRRDLALTEDAT